MMSSNLGFSALLAMFLLNVGVLFWKKYITPRDLPLGLWLPYWSMVGLGFTLLFWSKWAIHSGYFNACSCDPLFAIVAGISVFLVVFEMYTFGCILKEKSIHGPFVFLFLSFLNQIACLVTHPNLQLSILSWNLPIFKSQFWLVDFPEERRLDLLIDNTIAISAVYHLLMDYKNVNKLILYSLSCKNIKNNHKYHYLRLIELMSRFKLDPDCSLDIMEIEEVLSEIQKFPVDLEAKDWIIDAVVLILQEKNKALEQHFLSETQAIEIFLDNILWAAYALSVLEQIPDTDDQREQLEKRKAYLKDILYVISSHLSLCLWGQFILLTWMERSLKTLTFLPEEPHLIRLVVLLSYLTGQDSHAKELLQVLPQSEFFAAEYFIQACFTSMNDLDIAFDSLKQACKLNPIWHIRALSSMPLAPFFWCLSTGTISVNSKPIVPIACG